MVNSQLVRLRVETCRLLKSEVRSEMVRCNPELDGLNFDYEFLVRRCVLYYLDRLKR